MPVGPLAVRPGFEVQMVGGRKNLEADEKEQLRQMIAEEVRACFRTAQAAQLCGLPVSRGTAGQFTSIPLLHGIPPLESATPPEGPVAAFGAEEGTQGLAHTLAHTQADIGNLLEASLQHLDQLVQQAKATAEKIRDILRRTEAPTGGMRR